MIIAIDESGVHKQVGKSTIALVYVMADDIESTEQLVLDAERVAHVPYFHWAHYNWKKREAFFETIAAGIFKIKIAYISNPIVLDRALIDALEHILIERKVNQILIDGNKPKLYLRQLKKVLRDKGITVQKVRAVNDQAYPLIRIANAIAGAARAAHDNPSSKAAALFGILQDKIEIQIDL